VEPILNGLAALAASSRVQFIGPLGDLWGRVIFPAERSWAVRATP